MKAAAAPVIWSDVMAGLTGLRLAVHDELLRLGAMNYETIAAQLGASTNPVADLGAALAWLQAHRLLVVEDGQWRAVHPTLAKVQVEMSGLADVGAVVHVAKAPPRQEPPAKARAQTANVQRHQVEFFTLEGYRDSNGSRD